MTDDLHEPDKPKDEDEIEEDVSAKLLFLSFSYENLKIGIVICRITDYGFSFNDCYCPGS